LVGGYRNSGGATTLKAICDFWGSYAKNRQARDLCISDYIWRHSSPFLGRLISPVVGGLHQVRGRVIFPILTGY
jgi:hypothetical protein